MILTLVLYFTISHILSFICSVFEAVLFSCTLSFIELQKKQAPATGKILEELKMQINQPLAAILTLNTISHTFGAAGVGACVQALFGNKWIVLGSVILTLTMLYWTEMLPKTIGAHYWKKLAPFCARPIKWMIFITYPFVFSFHFFAKFFFHGKHDKITEEDIRIALESGARAGVIEEAEHGMVENIFRLSDRNVGVLMIPRVDIEWIDIQDDPEEIKEKILSLKYEYYLVCDGKVDKLLGIIKSSDLLLPLWERREINLRELLRPPLYVYENIQTFELMEYFKEALTQMAIVTDEYGVIQGIITMQEIMDAIMKDIDQEGVCQIFQVGHNSWLLDGKMPIDEFKEIFGLSVLPEEERARFRTLSGFCMNQLGAIPQKGSTFTLGLLRFEIVRVKRRRVEKILLTKREGS